MADTQAQAFRDSLLAGGECGRLIASRNWSATPLGPLDAWPGSLRTATSLLLRSPVPMVMLWGTDGVMIYNDAYSVFAARRHPELLGSKVREGWREVADFNDNVMRVGLAGGTLAYRDQELTLLRNGRPERVWMNLDYSPVIDESGRPAGVLAIVVETTGRVAAERRNAFLLKLGDALRPLADPLAIQDAAASVLGEYLGAARVAYAEDGGDGETVVVTCNYTDGVPCMKGTYRYADYGVELLAELRAGRAVVRSDIEGDPRLAEPEKAAHAALGLGATLNVPLVKAGRLVGILAVHHSGAHAFSQDEIALTQEVAERTWASVERARAEAGLRASEERLKQVQEAAEIGSFDFDRTTDKAIASPQYLDLYGLDESWGNAFSYGKWISLVHPEDRDAIAAETQEAVSDPKRRHLNYDFRIIRADTEATRWIAARTKLIRDRDGTFVRSVGAQWDITDRKVAEAHLRELNDTLEARVAERTAALAESERRARAILDTSFQLMGLGEPDGTIVIVNQAALDAAGVTQEQVAGLKIWDAPWWSRSPAERKRLRREVARVARGEFVRYETNLVMRDGRVRSFDFSMRAVLDGEGRPVQFVAEGRDITDAKAAQSALLEAERGRREADALYRAYFENSPEALFVIGVGTDGGFFVEELNPAHEAGVGFKLEDVRGKRIEEILPPDVASRVLETYRSVAETGELYQYREEFDLAGDLQHWDTSLVPVRDGEGRITRLIGSSRNVTRQVMAEEALRQAQKMEAVGQLTGGIAHDFNNLLGAVVGSLDLIRRKPGDIEKVKRFAEAGLEAAERGAKLTGQLLTFSRAQRIELKPVIVSGLVEGMRDLLARTLGPMVRLGFTLDGDGAVLSDATQLEMAVLNLAINARDAMPNGGDLTINTRPHRAQGDGELRAGEYVELSVTDTGSGMPSDVAARAFDPFFTTKGIGKGTGLGLSQVYGIAKQAGGTVRIESRPGAGTAVRIYLPRTHAPLEAGAEPEADGAVTPESGATILVIDDDPDIRRMLVASLVTLGFQVLEAQDGPAGLAALEENSPDLMMVDFAMPGMNGAEVAKSARERRPDLPIVFASGYADTAAIEAVAGEDAPVLRKPFRLDDLQAVLTEALTSRSLADRS